MITNYVKYLSLAIYLLTLPLGAIEPVDSDGKAYPVSKIYLSYAREHPDQIPISELQQIKIDLEETDSGYVGFREGEALKSMSLKNRLAANTNLYSSAIISLSQQIVAYYNKAGIIGVYVSVDPNQIDSSGQDLRDPAEDWLNLVVSTYSTETVKAIEVGNRFDDDDSVSLSAYDRLIKHSPVQAGSGGGDLIDQEELDEYALLLSRYPLRRVDVQLTPGQEGHTLNVDLLVNDDKPWRVYGNVTNTGTTLTSDWVERFGAIHYHVTGGDDILSFEYVTTSFENFHAVSGSYDAPLYGTARARWSVFGSWSDFVASQFGRFTNEFMGTQYRVGVNLTWTMWQHKKNFVDLIAQLRWHHVDVNNQLVNLRGTDDYFIPSITIRYDKRDDDHTVIASISGEGNLPSVLRTDAVNTGLMGRTNADIHWWVLQAYFYGSYFLDSWCGDQTVTRVAPYDYHHEVSFLFDGQFAFKYRLIPQLERVVGGATTVRGFPQSAIAGPTAYVTQSEYRYHLWSTDRKWHFTGRAFVDAGGTYMNQRTFLETNEAMAGGGIGGEIDYNNRIRFSFDFGVALTNLAPANIRPGNREGHISLTAVY